MPKLARRALTIPGVLGAAAITLAASPLWLPLLLVIDLLRGQRFASTRTGLFLLALLCCESTGIVASFVVWLRHGPWRGAPAERFVAANVALQNWWAGTLLGAAQRLFAFRLETSGMQELERTPYLLFPRHASLADTLLPVVLIARPLGVGLRYVLKRELLWGPCLDIVGHRLPNHFVDRDPDDSKSEIAAVGALVRGLADNEIGVIYPEGTRFTPEKAERIRRRLRERGAAESADRYEHVLPPRPGGPLAFVANAPGVDVVFCAHHGFEAAAGLPDLWSGRLIGATIRVDFRRVPAAMIPTDADARREWLFTEWERLDDWIDATPPACPVD